MSHHNPFRQKRLDLMRMLGFLIIGAVVMGFTAGGLIPAVPGTIAAMIFAGIGMYWVDESDLE